MKITIRTDRFGGMLDIWKPRKPIGSEAEVIRYVRRVGPYGPKWRLVKAISRQLVFERGDEESIVTYEIKD